MEKLKFTWGGVLRVIFNSVSKSPAHLAEFYIDRDRTLVYRWMRDEAAPPYKLLPDIIRFVTESSISAERIMLRLEMDAYILSSSLSDEIKEGLSGEEDFEKYITGVLRMALAERRNKSPATPPRITVPLKSIIFALLAAVSGGLIWNVINHLLSLGFYMGGSGNEPIGTLAFVWGLTLGVPVIAFALLSLKAKPTSPVNAPIYDWRLVAAIYSVAAGAVGFIFYNSGFRGFIEGLGYAYGLQEIIIVIVYSALLSFPPLLSVFALLRFQKTGWRLLATIIAAPVLISVLSVLGTALVDRPEPEVAQLRGFLVGLVLRLTMFIAVRIVLSGSQKGFALKALKNM